MHLIPKIIYFYFLTELILMNNLFINFKEYISILILLLSFICLVISIGLRKLFSKYFLEYLYLVNLGYLFLCFLPLNQKSLDFCTSFIYFYIIILLFYGTLLTFSDKFSYRNNKISFNYTSVKIDLNNNYFSFFFFIIFIFLGSFPMKEYGFFNLRIPFNGFCLQWVVIQSLLSANMYLMSFILIICNYIYFFLLIWIIFDIKMS